MPTDLKIQAKGKEELSFQKIIASLTDPLVGSVDASSPNIFDFGDGTTAEILSPTRIEITYPGGRATLTFGEPLDFKGSDEELAWTEQDWRDLGQLLETDARITFKGGQGDDFLLGGQWGDRLSGGGGDDTLGGGAGDDQIKGGRGNDLMLSGTGNDVMIGGPGHDAFVFESSAGDRVRANGGSGNDIFVDMGEGHATWQGGAGADVFVIGIQTTMGGTPEGFTASLTAQIDGFTPSGTGGTTVITDFSADDLLIFSGVQTTMDGNPSGIWTDLRPGASLADWDGSGADAFVFRDTNRGVEIGWGDEVVMLQGLSAADVLLDQIHFGGGLGDIFPQFDNGETASIGYSPAGSTLDVWKAPANVVIGQSGTSHEPFESIMFETFADIGGVTAEFF